MTKTPLKLAVPLLAALALVSACSGVVPVDPAAEAKQAEAEFRRGNLPSARRHIRAAIAVRDDVSAYWLLSGRIAKADYEDWAAYQAYQTAQLLDRGNLEALEVLCSVGARLAPMDEVDGYADQLLKLRPNSQSALLAKGFAAVRRGDVAVADGFADRLLSKSPQNAGGLVLKAQVLVRQNRQAEAGPLLENALKTLNYAPGTGELLEALIRLYAFQLDRPKYEDVAIKRSYFQPDNIEAQLEVARLYYEDGVPNDARERLAGLMAKRPNDPRVRQAIVELWVTQGKAAMPLDRLVADGQRTSRLMRTAYAAYANAIGRPDLTRTLLAKDVAEDQTDDAGHIAKAEFAQALAQSGDRAQASQMLDQILSANPDQPDALVVRSKIALATGDSDAALADARRAAGNDPSDVSAQLVLADVLERRFESDLLISALRSARVASPRNVRLAARLAEALIARNRKREAAEVMKDLARESPISLRVEQLRAAICPRTGVADCATPVPPDPVRTII